MRVFLTVNKFTVSGLLILLSAVVAVPAAIAQTEDPNETRIEKYEDLTETEADTTSQADMEEMELEYEDGMSQPETRTEETLQEAQSSDYNSYDVRRTEAFNLVSSAYRGDFEDQGINGYATLITDYETGNLTAEDVINAAIESGELSPMALEDSSYVEAVDSQLMVLTES